jgi:hypothetical protein
MTAFPGSPKPPKHVLAFQQAQDLFEPYKSLLAECIQYAWDQWVTFYQPKHYLLQNRSRANIIYDEIVARVAEKFNGLPNVVFKKSRGLFWLYFGDQISVRFKKLSKDGRCHNIKTRQQYMFSLQLEIPGMEKGSLFNAGYEVDSIGNLVRKAIVCPFGNRVLYQIALLTEANAPIEIPENPQPKTPKTPKTSRFEINPQALPESEQVKKRKKRKG